MGKHRAHAQRTGPPPPCPPALAARSRPLSRQAGCAVQDYLALAHKKNSHPLRTPLGVLSSPSPLALISIGLGAFLIADICWREAGPPKSSKRPLRSPAYTVQLRSEHLCSPTLVSHYYPLSCRCATNGSCNPPLRSPSLHVQFQLAREHFYWPAFVLLSPLMPRYRLS